MVVIRQCNACGQSFQILPKTVQKLLHAGHDLPVRCKECNSLKAKVRILVCKTCKSDFEFNAIQEHKLRVKYGDEYRDPCYCDTCRATWRKENTNRED